MTQHALITGGAGFIGSHLADELLARGYRVRALDALVPQVHGDARRRPAYLSPEVELIVGDVRDRERVKRALEGIDVVFHLAAAVGVGQSMYEVSSYTSVNGVGTAVLLEALIARPVSRLVVASSMSVYGEGLYRDRHGTLVADARRTPEQLERGIWTPLDVDGQPLEPIPTPEGKAPVLESVYALGKHDQEQMCLITGRAYGIPTVALRLFNVYGPRQALSNPYTGVMAIFASRLLNGKPPVIFEDGRQQRDFVHVSDVARAMRLAAETPSVRDVPINVASGEPVSILEIANLMTSTLGKAIEPSVSGQFRAGDIRHCTADISRAQQRLGYAPIVTLRDGLQQLCSWLAGQEAVDRFDAMRSELIERRLAG